MTNTLPPCPLCGSEPVFCRDFWSCSNGACELGGPRDTRRGLAWLALCARSLPAGHVAVPESEIEALRGLTHGHVTTKYDRCAIETLIARLPRKVDHVAVLERMAKENCPHGEERAALEAAIVRMREGER